MAQPRISIITFCRDQAVDVESTLCSVLDQGYRQLEFLVVDQGSTDGSHQIIKRYEPGLTWFTNTPFDGAAAAINQALSRATGEIVAILPCGDLYLPGALQAVANLWNDGHPTFWLVGRCAKIEADDTTPAEFRFSRSTSLISLLKHNAGNWPLACTFWSRRLIRDHGTMNADLKTNFDFEYWCRLMATGHKPQFVEDPIFAAHREPRQQRDPDTTLRIGLEALTVASHYAPQLSLRDRYDLWINCDLRRRIYALAEAELHGQHATRRLLKQAVRRPWWLAHEPFRRNLLQGISHPVPEKMLRPAA